MNQHEKINYVEFPSRNLALTKAFFEQVFAWEFQDYGPNYCAFDNQGIEGGFYADDKVATTALGSALIVFYSQDLLATQNKIVEAKGEIIKPIFEFPGGRRFHFTEPSGNEFAVWSDHT